MDLMNTPQKNNKESLVILVVEDHTSFVKTIKQLLSNHKLHYAKSVDQAFESYKIHLPDITIMDINLLDGSGHEAMQLIREFDPSAYIIMLTGSAQKQDIVKSQKASVNGYVLKPPTHKSLMKYIDQYYSYRKQLNDKLIEETNQTRQQLNQPASTNQVALSALIIGNQHADDFLLIKALGTIDCNAEYTDFSQEALEKISKQKYHLIIIDTELGKEAEALNLANRINQFDRVHHRAISHIIGLGHKPKEEIDWLGSGMHAYFTKPVPAKALCTYVVHNRKIIQS